MRSRVKEVISATQRDGLYVAKPRKESDLRYPKDGLYAAKPRKGGDFRHPKDGLYVAKPRKESDLRYPKDGLYAAKHEARLSNISPISLERIVPKLIRDSSPATAGSE